MTPCLACALAREPLWLLKADGSRKDAPVVDDHADDTTGRSGIRCPRCRWQPSRHDRWTCNCTHVWNTFDTRGICPACGYQWRETQCPRCSEWSPHEDWYLGEVPTGVTR